MLAPADFLATTRSSYDAVAVDYAAHFRDELAARPVERSVLGLFASVVHGPVLDVGCGTGLATAYPHDLGVAISGLDLSPGMLAVARSSLPGLEFTVGSMLSLPTASGSLGGVLAWYSTVHVPDDLLPRALAEFYRVLTPGGHLLLAFQVGDEPLHMTSGLGHPIALDFHRRRPSRVAELLREAGLTIRARTVREPEDDTETTPQSFLLAHKPA